MLHQSLLLVVVDSRMTRFILLFSSLFIVPSVLLCTQTQTTKQKEKESLRESSSKKSKFPGETRCNPVSKTILDGKFGKFIQLNYTSTLNQYKQFMLSETLVTDCGKSQSKQLDKQPNTVCKSNIICSHDKHRFPPVVYHVYCQDDMEYRGKFQCENATSSVWVLRKQACERKNDKKPKTEKWTWEREQVGVGCNIKNTPNNTHRVLEEIRRITLASRKGKRRNGRDTM